MRTFLLGLTLGVIISTVGLTWAGSRDHFGLPETEGQRYNRQYNDAYDIVPGLPSDDLIQRDARRRC